MCAASSHPLVFAATTPAIITSVPLMVAKRERANVSTNAISPTDQPITEAVSPTVNSKPGTAKIVSPSKMA